MGRARRTPAGKAESTPPKHVSDSPGENTESAPEIIVTRCSRCANQLSVSERMSYFVQAEGTLPVCGVCRDLARGTPSGPSMLSPGGLRGPETVAFDRSAALSPTTGGHGIASIRTNLVEDLNRLSRSMAQLPEDDAGRSFALGLYLEADRELSSDKLLDAEVAIENLRETVIEMVAPRARAETRPLDD